MTPYTYKDIEKFLLDDELFQWAKYGTSVHGFDLESYKLRHPGFESQIDLAVAVIRGVKVVENAPSTTASYKMHSLQAMLNKARKEDVQETVVASLHSEVSVRRRWMMSVASVAALFILCWGVYYGLMNSQTVSNSQQMTAMVMDSLRHSSQVQIILDGEQAVGFEQNNAAIRMEEDGTVRVDEQLVAEARNEKVSVHQVIVPYGKRSKIYLPDGSTLWINSGSCISYASDFQTNRTLNVQGEVYLDVKKDAEHPFVVKTNRLEVTVLGTSFNVTDYERDNESAVVLVQGSVDVTLDNQMKKRLVPSQRLTNENGVLKVDKVDVYNYICWKDDLMKFNGQKLSDILQSLSKYYDVKMEVSGCLKDEQFYGSLDLNCSVEDVLSTISLATPLQIEKEDNVIYIKPKK